MSKVWRTNPAGRLTFHAFMGSLVFMVSLVAYVLSMEPSVSWWDCGEFIASAFRLEPGHPPGAPLFMLLGRFFTLFAPDASNAAYLINLMSAIAGALTVFFLYHTLVMLVRRTGLHGGRVFLPWAEAAAGAAGALVYAFTDTAWFSAVEAEVYSLSSLFTAVVFWAILRWDREADEASGQRWLLLIAYLIGLSIGVHLLNLLTLPAITLFWYYRTHPGGGRKGSFAAFGVSLLLLALLMSGIIPGTVALASWFELFFVNLFHLPYNSGLIIFILLLVLGLVWGIRETHLQGKAQLNTVILALTFMLTGYSSYAVIMIRSAANPPMDQTDPDNIFSLSSYLNREQYGDRPLFRGPWFNAPQTGQKPGRAIYGKVNHRYEIVDRIYKPVYDSRFMTVFPRMWSAGAGHSNLYKKWSRMEGKPEQVTDAEGITRQVVRPTFIENLRFLIGYQLGHMYFRYFMWNFSGRQNDTESQGGIRSGNWITGIGFIDNSRLGPQKDLPDRDRNSRSRNRYYLLPLLLGVAGAVFQYRISKRDFRVILMLFFFTGVAIVLYLNQYPNQPRERDYSYAGSFYAFAIWVGFGVAALTRSGVRGRVPAFAGMTKNAFAGMTKNAFAGMTRNAFAGMTGRVIVIVTALGVPVLMALENWDDHDRSGRMVVHDIAYNYLNSCAPGAILFTAGDNDTFPLWYLQEVEGIRTDVRVICLPYLASAWYITQLKRQQWLSDPVPFSLTPEQYGPGRHDYTPVVGQLADTVDLGRLVAFMVSDDAEAKLPLRGGGFANYMPARNLRLPVDREEVLANGTVRQSDSASILPEIIWRLNRSSLYKNDLMILDLLAANGWKRPVCFTSLATESIMGLQDFFRPEGFIWRLVPLKWRESSIAGGRIDTNIQYELLMNRFRWGNSGDTSLLVDYHTYQMTLVLGIRQKFADLAGALIDEGKLDSALAVAGRVAALLPAAGFRPDEATAAVAEVFYRAGAPEQGDSLLGEYVRETGQELRYLSALNRTYPGMLAEEYRFQRAVAEALYTLAETWDRKELAGQIGAVIEKTGDRE